MILIVTTLDHKYPEVEYRRITIDGIDCVKGPWGALDCNWREE